ncbi:hypothetical protein QEH57_09365 [Pelagicoccus sp. SDUM812005]|nr:hypothetical protein [Pelagicoccus sp. SDUM812005]
MHDSPPERCLEARHHLPYKAPIHPGKITQANQHSIQLAPVQRTNPARQTAPHPFRVFRIEYRTSATVSDQRFDTLALMPGHHHEIAKPYPFESPKHAT